MSSDFNERQFRDYLGTAKGNLDIERTVEIARIVSAEAEPAEADSFVKQMRVYDSLIESMVSRGYQTYDDFVAIVRYAAFAGNEPLYAAVLERIDAVEVMPALRDEVASRFGPDMSDEIFGGIELPGPETKPSYFPRVTRLILERMTSRIAEGEIHEILCAIRHALPKDFRSAERRKYLDAGSVDAYLDTYRSDFLANLASCRDTGKLFYNQPISAQGYDFVEANLEISGVVRDGDYLYKTKIPYMLDAYLAADDQDKPYYACHCPWARESLNRARNLDTKVPSGFCSCSAGFVVQPFEMAFDTKLEIETLETALDGHPVCRFRIRLPEHLTRSTPDE